MTEPLGAGRELDTLIATEVMGWEAIDPSRCPVCGWPWEGINGHSCTPGKCSTRPLPLVRYDTRARFSTTISAAWMVVDKMRDRGWDFDIRNFGTYTAAFHEQRSLMGASCSADAETAPLAICLAALAAIRSVEAP